MVVYIAILSLGTLALHSFVALVARLAMGRAVPRDSCLCFCFVWTFRTCYSVHNAATCDCPRAVTSCETDLVPSEVVAGLLSLKEAGPL